MSTIPQNTAKASQPSNGKRAAPPSAPDLEDFCDLEISKSFQPLDQKTAQATNSEIKEKLSAQPDNSAAEPVEDDYAAILNTPRRARRSQAEQVTLVDRATAELTEKSIQNDLIDQMARSATPDPNAETRNSIRTSIPGLIAIAATLVVMIGAAYLYTASAPGASALDTAAPDAVEAP